MARVSNPLIGATKQSVGNSTFSTWKGIYVLKSKPASVANPRTDGQVMQRSAITQLVALFRFMPQVVKAGFRQLAVRMSEFNAWTSYNVRFGFNFSAPPTATLTPGSLLFSKGTIAMQDMATNVASQGGNNVTWTWDASNLSFGQSNTDKFAYVILGADGSFIQAAVTNILRSAETAVIAMDNFNIINGTHYFLNTFFVNTSTGKSDTSQPVDVVAGA